MCMCVKIIWQSSCDLYIIQKKMFYIELHLDSPLENYHIIILVVYIYLYKTNYFLYDFEYFSYNIHFEQFFFFFYIFHFIFISNLFFENNPLHVILIIFKSVYCIFIILYSLPRNTSHRVQYVYGGRRVKKNELNATVFFF